MAENTIKASAKQKNISLFADIKDFNLTKYYKEFTFGFSGKFRHTGESTASKNINEKNCE